MLFHSCRAGDDGGRPAEVSVEKKVNYPQRLEHLEVTVVERKIHHNRLQFTC